MNYIIVVITWILVLLSSISVSLVNLESKSIDISMILSFSFMLILIVSQIIYWSRKKRNLNIINSILPFLYFTFLLLRNYMDWGNGEARGILGYDAQLGILSALNISKTVAFICLCVFYVVISIAFIFKYCFLINRNKKIKNSDIIKKVIISIISILCLYVLISGITYYINISRLNGLFVLSCILYWIVYGVLSGFFILLEPDEAKSK